MLNVRSTMNSAIAAPPIIRHARLRRSIGQLQDAAERVAGGHHADPRHQRIQDDDARA